MKAYEACLAATSTRHAPWFIVPADNKMNARLMVSKIVLQTLADLDLNFPKPDAKRKSKLRSFEKFLKK